MQTLRYRFICKLLRSLAAILGKWAKLTDGWTNDLFRGMGRGGTPQLCEDPTFQGLDQRSEMEEVVPKMERRKALMRDHPREGELDPAVDRRCEKNSPSV